MDIDQDLSSDTLNRLSALQADLIHAAGVLADTHADISKACLDLYCSLWRFRDLEPRLLHQLLHSQQSSILAHGLSLYPEMADILSDAGKAINIHPYRSIGRNDLVDMIERAGIPTRNEPNLSQVKHLRQQVALLSTKSTTLILRQLARNLDRPVRQALRGLEPDPLPQLRAIILSLLPESAHESDDHLTSLFVLLARAASLDLLERFFDLHPNFLAETDSREKTPTFGCLVVDDDIASFRLCIANGGRIGDYISQIAAQIFERGSPDWYDLFRTEFSTDTRKLFGTRFHELVCNCTPNLASRLHQDVLDYIGDSQALRKKLFSTQFMVFDFTMSYGLLRAYDNLKFLAYLLSANLLDPAVASELSHSIDDDDLQALFDKLSSAHGRLALIEAEPDPIAILSRNRFEPFFGLNTRHGLLRGRAAIENQRMARADDRHRRS